MLNKEHRRRLGTQREKEVQIRAWVLMGTCSAFIFGLLWYTALTRDDATRGRSVAVVSAYTDDVPLKPLRSTGRCTDEIKEHGHDRLSDVPLKQTAAVD